jgi:hypothetical protein
LFLLIYNLFSETGEMIQYNNHSVNPIRYFDGVKPLESHFYESELSDREPQITIGLKQ